MTTATVERQELHQVIDALPDKYFLKLAEYVEELIEEEEEAEDIAYIDARRNEPTVPFSEIIKDYETQHGTRHKV